MSIRSPEAHLFHSPDTNGKENVEDTDAITPMIEKANATVSNFYNDLSKLLSIVNSSIRTENSRLNSLL